MAAKRIPDKVRNQIIAHCRAGHTGTSAAIKFDVSNKFVFALLKQAGVHLPKKPRLFSLDESVLDEITPISAYWIGFIFADGYIVSDHPKRSPKVVVHLAEMDFKHLNKLRNFFCSEHKLVRAKANRNTYGGPSYFWSVRSRNIYDRLRNYGMGRGPESNPVRKLACSRDFWRGVVDGDGGIGTTNSKGKHYASFKLYGYVSLLEQFVAFAARKGIDTLIIEKDPRPKKCWVVRAGGKRAEKIIQLLYANNAIALSRKNKRAQAIVAGVIQRCTPYGE